MKESYNVFVSYNKEDDYQLLTIGRSFKSEFSRDTAHKYCAKLLSSGYKAYVKIV